MKDIRSTANLNNAIYLLIDPSKDSADDIAADISQQLSGYRDCMIYLKEKLMYYTPLRLMNYMFEKNVKDKHSRGLHPFSGIITNLDKIDIRGYPGGGFISESWFRFPANRQLLPMFITLTGRYNFADMALGLLYRMLINGRIYSLMEAIVNGLSPA